MRRLALIFIFGIASLALPLGAHADSPTYHTVAWGETLYSIARSYSISPQSLASANGLSLNTWVYAGEGLTIPLGAKVASPVPQMTPSGIYTIRAGDTLFSIAQQFSISLDALAAANNLPPNGVIYVGWQLTIPASGQVAALQKTAPPIATAASRVSSASYIVQPGDTLFRIALDHGVSTQAIALANNLPTFFVYSGQRLTIPTRNGTPNVTSNSTAPVAASSALNLLLNGIPLYRQQQTLTCEEAAVAMALRGALSESQILKAMPRSDNPFAGIRGSTNYPLLGGLTNYGVYAQGLQIGLAALGRASTVLYGQAFGQFQDAVLNNLRAGRAVVWWTTWRQTYQTPRWIKTSSGASVKLVPYEHTVVLVGANDRGVTYHDPYDGTVRSTSWSNFQRVSSYFSNMGLVIQ